MVRAFAHLASADRYLLVTPRFKARCTTPCRKMAAEVMSADGWRRRSRLIDSDVPRDAAVASRGGPQRRYGEQDFGDGERGRLRACSRYGPGDRKPVAGPSRMRPPRLLKDGRSRVDSRPVKVLSNAPPADTRPRINKEIRGERWNG